jgi:hypothetical protein
MKADLIRRAYGPLYPYKRCSKGCNYCYIGHDIYMDRHNNPTAAKRFHEHRYYVCPKCRTKPPINQWTGASASNRHIAPEGRPYQTPTTTEVGHVIDRELAVRIPGLFVGDACPKTYRRGDYCKCTYLGGCKIWNKIRRNGEKKKRVRSARKTAEACTAIIEFLEPAPYEGGEHKLAETLSYDRSLVHKALIHLEQSKRITRTATKGRNGGTTIELLPS